MLYKVGKEINDSSLLSQYSIEHNKYMKEDDKK